MIQHKSVSFIKKQEKNKNIVNTMYCRSGLNIDFSYNYFPTPQKNRNQYQLSH